MADLHVNVTASASSEYSQPPGMACGCERVKEVNRHSLEIRTHKRNRSIQESLDWRGIKKYKRSVATHKLTVISTLVVKVSALLMRGIFFYNYLAQK